MTHRFLPILFLALLPNFAFADACVWKLTRQSEVLYIGGTIHLLDEKNATLPEEYEAAYQKSDTIVFETSIAETETQEFIDKLQASGTYTDGRNLTSILSTENYAALANAFRKYGLDLSPQMTASFAVLVLTQIDLEVMGYTAEGVDKRYFVKASADGKKILELESADDQLAIIAQMGEGYENEFVSESLSERERMHDLFDDMVASWRKGDLEEFWKISFAETEERLPKLYRSLLLERNEKWIPLIEQISAQPGNAFVMVGAGHLPGETGVLKLLESKGYSVEPLRLPEPALAE